MDRSELIIKINVIKQLGTPIEDLISLIDEQNKEVAIDFCQWQVENGFYMLLGTTAWECEDKGKQYSTEELYDFFIQSKQITK